VGKKEADGQTVAIFRRTHYRFLHAKAATALAHLSHRNSVRPFFCPSVTRVDQSKMVQAMITRFPPLASGKTLVSGTVKLFHKFERGHPERGQWMRGGRENLRYPADMALAERDTSRWVRVKQYRHYSRWSSGVFWRLRLRFTGLLNMHRSCCAFSFALAGLFLLANKSLYLNNGAR